MKEIETITWFKKQSRPIPLRFKIETEDKSNIVIKINKILFQEEEKICGNRMIIYRCEGVIQNRIKVFELKYNISNYKWYLFKM